MTKNDCIAGSREGFSVVEALIGSCALVGLLYGVTDLMISQRRNVAYHESRMKFTQGRFSVGELVRNNGPEICQALGFAPAEGRVLPTSSQVQDLLKQRQAAKDSGSTPPDLPEIFGAKALSKVNASASRSLASVGSSLPSNISASFILDPEKYACVPASDGKSETCSSDLLFSAVFASGASPQVDRFPIKLQADLTSGANRKLASCSLGDLAVGSTASGSSSSSETFERTGIIPLGAQDFDLGSDFKRLTFLGHLQSGDASPFGGFLIRQSDNTIRATLTAEGRFYGDFVLNSEKRCIWLDGKIYLYSAQPSSPVCLNVDNQGHARISFASYMRSSFVAEGLAVAPAAAAITQKVEPAFESISVGCNAECHFYREGFAETKCPAGKKIVPGTALSWNMWGNAQLAPNPYISVSTDETGITCRAGHGARSIVSMNCTAICY